MKEPLTRYQRFVVFAAWIGLGFDLMDSLLFNFVSPIALPNLLALPIGSPEAKAATGVWTGILTSVMLLGWAVGGIAFGRISDRIGRSRTVFYTMMLYSCGTLACAISPNLLLFGVFRFIAALGIGGEWGAGATLVAETVPESRRVQMGAFLFTSAPAGVFVAIAVSRLFTSGIPSIASNPSLSWRLVMAAGSVPALFAVFLRRGLKEPAAFEHADQTSPSGIAELFSPALRKRTLGGLVVTTAALLTFWVSSAYIPTIATFLADESMPKPSAAALPAIRAALVTRAMTSFNLGGLVGVLLVAPLAERLGRRRLFLAIFGWSAAWLLITFVPEWPANLRLLFIGILAISTYGVFGAFQFYLPELFPTRLRGTGSGFCLNAGRLLTVGGPLVVAYVAKRGTPVMEAMQYLAVVPTLAVALLMIGFGEETRGRTLETSVSASRHP